MAAGQTRLFLSNGQTVSIYSDASAVGNPMYVNISGAAGTSSPKYFMVTSRTMVTDILCDAHPTSGVLRLFANGIDTGVQIPVDARWLASINRKGYLPRFGFRPGVKYSFIPSTITS